MHGQGARAVLWKQVGFYPSTREFMLATFSNNLAKGKDRFSEGMGYGAAVASIDAPLINDDLVLEIHGRKIVVPVWDRRLIATAMRAARARTEIDPTEVRNRVKNGEPIVINHGARVTGHYLYSAARAINGDFVISTRSLDYGEDLDTPHTVRTHLNLVTEAYLIHSSGVIPGFERSTGQIIVPEIGGIMTGSHKLARAA